MNPSSKSPALPPTVVLFFGILAVSTASIFIRFAQAEAPSLVIAAYRLTIAAVILVPVAILRRREELRTLSRSQIGLLVLAGVFLAGHFASWITSLEYTSVASSVVLVTTTPLWVAMVSPLFLNEKLAKTVWVGLVVAILGGAIVGLRESCDFSNGLPVCAGLGDLTSGQTLKGNLLALLGAFLSAGYITVGRRARATLSLETYTALVYGVSAVVLLGLVFLTGQSMVGYSPQTMGWFLALAIVPQLIGHSIFNWALAYLPAAYVSIALLGEPVGTTILAMAFLRESPTPIEILGGAMILIGIYLASLRRK